MLSAKTTKTGMDSGIKVCQAAKKFERHLKNQRQNRPSFGGTAVSSPDYRGIRAK